MADSDSERLFPRDLFARVDAVLEFIAAHVGVQNSLDDRPGRGVAEWVGLVGSSVGAAAELIVTDAADPDAVRAVSGWLACASADCLRARAALRAARDAPAPGGMADDLDDLRAHLVTALELESRWSPPAQLVLVYRDLGAVADACGPLVFADPSMQGAEPPMRAALLEALEALDPGSTARRPPMDEPDDPLGDTLDALQELAHTAAAAAALLHPGGQLGMPPQRNPDLG